VVIVEIDIAIGIEIQTFREKCDPDFDLKRPGEYRAARL
jgi:hypothetical protein